MAVIKGIIVSVFGSDSISYRGQQKITGRKEYITSSLSHKNIFLPGLAFVYVFQLKAIFLMFFFYLYFLYFVSHSINVTPPTCCLFLMAFEDLQFFFEISYVKQLH